VNSKKLWLNLLIILAVTAGCSSSGDDTPGTPSTPDTAPEYTARGWQYFESDHYGDALADFNEALVLMPGYGQALGGKGWSELKLAENSSDLTTAVASFEAAISAGEDGSYVTAGLASAHLALGGSHLVTADNLALSIVTNDPNFVFSHQTSINRTDMVLIAAFAMAASGQFSDALYRADLIEDSGIEADDPATWEVSGTSYTQYNAAVLARLYQLSELYSG